MRRIRRTALVLAFWPVLVGLAGCREDRCRSHPAAVQIDLRLEGLSTIAVAAYDVALTVNARPTIARRFSQSEPPSFTFQFGHSDEAPRQLAIVATALNAAGGSLGEGRRSISFSSDACNRVEVSLQAEGARDAQRAEGPRPDGPRPEGLRPEIPDAPRAEGPRPDGVRPDSVRPDGSIPDTLRPDGLRREGPRSEIQIPDGPRPDGPRPDGASCTAPKPPAGIAATRIVSLAAGDDSKATGTCVAHKTISAALKGASPGTVIWVEPGVYEAELFPLAIPAGVTLIGDSPTRGEGPPQSTVIRGSGPALAPNIHATFDLRDLGGRVEGFRIEAGSTAPGHFGVYSYGATTTLARSSFGSSEGGVTLAYGPATGGCLTIDDNRFTAIKVGIVSMCRSVLTVTGNEIKATERGIEISYGNAAVIAGNAIVDASLFGIDVFGYTAADAPLIKSNKLSGSGYSSFAIRLNGTAAATLRQNIFQLGASAGPAVLVDFQSSGVVNLGSGSDLGKNDFTAVTLGIMHNSSGTLSAVGNLWPVGGPICGTQIKTAASAKVTWGAAGESCP